VRLPAYPKYKPSGVEWLGDVPEHWVTWKVTHGFRKIGSGTTPKSDSSQYYDGDIPWVTTSELREAVITDTKQRITAQGIRDYPNLKPYSAGTLLLAMYGATIGRLGILGIAASVNQACCAFSRPIKFETKFVFYWLLMRRPILISLSTGGGQPNLSQDELRGLRIPVPPLFEQRSIVNFLDHRIAKIDTLIRKKEELIEKLQEKRSALISLTVTQGLPPEAAKAAGLSPRPKMKDSGTEWLGQIPEHWAMVKFSRSIFVVEGQVDPREEPFIDMPLIAPNHVEQATGRLLNVEMAREQQAESGKYLCRQGDVIYSKIRPALRKVVIAPTACLVQRRHVSYAPKGRTH
jgi:type I restriction enzyme, S subunit